MGHGREHRLRVRRAEAVVVAGTLAAGQWVAPSCQGVRGMTLRRAPPDSERVLIEHYGKHPFAEHNLPEASGAPPPVQLYREQVMQFRQDFNILLDCAAEVCEEPRKQLTPYGLYLYAMWMKEQKRRGLWTRP